MPLSRKRSCTACRQAKSRCDEQFPRCGRCQNRQLGCTYDSEWRYSPYQPPMAALSYHAPNPEPVTSDLELSLLEAGEDILAAASGKPAGNWPAFLDLSRADGDRPMSSSRESAAEHFSVMEDRLILSANQQSSSQIETVNAPAGELNSSELLATHDSVLAPRSLRPRSILGHCMLTSVIAGQLRGFPKMMVDGEQLPPFIQPRCHLEEQIAADCHEAGAHSCLPRHLAISSGLIKMFYDRTGMNAEFVWTSVYQQQRSIWDNYHSFDREQTLEALQALTVYLLLQADDPASLEKNNVHSLIRTAMSLCSYIWHQHGAQLSLANFRNDRKGWIFQESLNRVGLVLTIAALLFEGIGFKPNYERTDCPYGNDFSALFLPSSKQLWEARTNRVWRAALDQHVLGCQSTKMLRVGDVLDYEAAATGLGHGQQEAQESAVIQDIIQWCANVDHLGTLALMAFPFERWRKGSAATVWS